MKVELLPKRDAPLGFYEELTAKPEATPFHTVEWLAYLEKIISGAQTHFIVIEEDSDFLGMMPVILRKKGPIQWISSLPYGTYGGFLMKDHVHIKPLAESLRQLLSPKGAVTHIIDFNNTLPPLKGFSYSIQLYHFIELDEGYDYIWEKVYNNAQRNSQRVARKRGVTARKIETERELRIFYDMYRTTYAEKKSHTLSFEQLNLLMKHLKPSGIFHGLLAYYGEEPIAGVVNLFHPSMAVGFLQGSIRKYLYLRPVNLLIDETIRDAIDRGCRIFNLGVTPKNAEGTVKFKESFGARRGYFPVQSRTSLLYRAAKFFLS